MSRIFKNNSSSLVGVENFLWKGINKFKMIVSMKKGEKPIALEYWK